MRPPQGTRPSLTLALGRAGRGQDLRVTAQQRGWGGPAPGEAGQGCMCSGRLDRGLDGGASDATFRLPSCWACPTLASPAPLVKLPFRDGPEAWV